MKTVRMLSLVVLAAFGAAQVGAQPASAPGPGPRASGPGPGGGPGAGPRGAGPGPGAASAPGPGGRMGMGPGGRRGPHAGADYTPGWAMMSPKEREEHRARMQGAKTYDECRALQQQHHDEMAARARERGVTAPLAKPRRDACAGLKP